MQSIRELNLEEDFEQILTLYKDVGWVVYTDEPDRLRKAYLNSTYSFGLFEGNELKGVIRGLTDTEYLHYIQDIIVSTSEHNKGIGTELLKFVKDKYQNVRMDILLTDDDPAQMAYYKKNKFQNTKEITDYPLNCFVDFKTPLKIN